MITIHPSNKLLLIDSSYFVFYRFYATYNWYSLQKKGTDGGANISPEHVMSDPVFVEKYDKMFARTLRELFNTYKCDSWEDVVFVMDAPRDTIWRNALFRDYKISRHETHTRFNKNIFKHTYDVLLPKLRECYKFQTLGVPELEADDIISVIVSHVSPRDIVIITNDNDYIQLKDSHTMIYNLQGKDIASRVNMDPDKYLQVKIIMGDKSDCIPSIMKKVGPKTALKMVEDPAYLKTFLDKHPTALEQYEVNRRLIDMSYIPEMLKSRVSSLLKD